jgi:sec-independent protein translocase protein TatA
MPNIGFSELLIVFAIALLIFGNKLPTIGKSLGEGIRNFKKGLDSGDDEASDKPAQSAHQGAAPSQQHMSAAQMQPGSLQGAQAQKQESVDYVDVEHRDSGK